MIIESEALSLSLSLSLLLGCMFGSAAQPAWKRGMKWVVVAGELHICMVDFHWYCVVFCQKIRNFYHSDFFTRVVKMVLFHNFFLLYEESCIPYLELKIMKTNNKVNFLKLFFSIMTNKPPNTNI